ncbi:asparaginase [Metabacillus fastidiosus]|uniref:asparaginase n=1 Tax=Metabacillus fastidiosus TaxID=1458 RepID=UPI003D267D0B
MMKKVTLITTGGTIASKDIGGGLLSSGALSGEQLAALCKLPDDIEIKIVDLIQVPSMFMDFEKMSVLRAAVLNELNDESVSGIVITHGTDSLEETAYFLDVTIDNKKPVIVTGSQRSPEDEGTDVYSNLRNSIYAAAAEILKDAGTVAVFNERIYSAKYVKKVHASNLQGFHSFGYGYLGIIDNGVVNIYQKPVNHECYPLEHPLPRVDIIKCYTGADGFLIEAAVQASAKGIVLEGAGRGQAAPKMVDAIQAALDKGIAVVMTTSAEEGHVHPSYSYVGSGHDLMSRGVILGGDFDSKKARIKLAVLLSNFEEVIQDLF